MLKDFMDMHFHAGITARIRITVLIILALVFMAPSLNAQVLQMGGSLVRGTAAAVIASGKAVAHCACALKDATVHGALVLYDRTKSDQTIWREAQEVVERFEQRYGYIAPLLGAGSHASEAECVERFVEHNKNNGRTNITAMLKDLETISSTVRRRRAIFDYCFPTQGSLWGEQYICQNDADQALDMACALDRTYVHVHLVLWWLDQRATVLETLCSYEYARTFFEPALGYIKKNNPMTLKRALRDIIVMSAQGPYFYNNYVNELAYHIRVLRSGINQRGFFAVATDLVDFCKELERLKRLIEIDKEYAHECALKKQAEEIERLQQEVARVRAELAHQRASSALDSMMDRMQSARQHAEHMAALNKLAQAPQ